MEEGIPPAAQQVFTVLICPGVYLPWLGVPTLARGYLPWLGGYLPWLGVPTLARGVPTMVGTPPNGTWLG